MNVNSILIQNVRQNCCLIESISAWVSVPAGQESITHAPIVSAFAQRHGTSGVAKSGQDAARHGMTHGGIDGV